VIPRRSWSGFLRVDGDGSFGAFLLRLEQERKLDVLHRVVVDGGPILEIEKVKRLWCQHQTPRMPATTPRIHPYLHDLAPLLETLVTVTSITDRRPSPPNHAAWVPLLSARSRI
jgi:hypothetical protein